MCISAYSLMPYFSLLLPYISFISCTYWVPTISVLNLAIFPCHSSLLLRRRRWTGILQRGVLGYASPRLPFLWCYGVFRYSVSPRVTLVFKDINYVIIILYIYGIWLSVSTFGRMCGTIDHGSCIRWVLDFGIKIGYDRKRQHLMLDMTRHDHGHPHTPDRMYSSTEGHPIVILHNNSTTMIRIITIVTLTRDKHALVKAHLSIRVTVHQGPERSTPC
jgi:hypothetical protein